MVVPFGASYRSMDDASLCQRLSLFATDLNH